MKRNLYLYIMKVKIYNIENKEEIFKGSRGKNEYYL